MASYFLNADGSMGLANAAITGGDLSGALVYSCDISGSTAVAGSLGLWGEAPVSQATAAIVGSPNVSLGTGTPIADDATFGDVDGAYTFGQVVAALKRCGILR